MILRYTRVARSTCELALKIAAAHRMDYFTKLLTSLVGAGAAVGVIQVVFSRAGQLAGWSHGEVIILLGTFQIVTGILNSAVEPSLSWFAEKVLRGEIDGWLLLPLPSSLAISLRLFSAPELAQSALGIGIVLYPFTRGTVSVGPGQVALYLVGLVLALVAMWASRLTVAAIAFWAPHFEPSLLYRSVWQFGQFPVGVYPTGAMYALLFATPTIVVSTVPTRLLTKGPDEFLVLGVVSTAIQLAVALTLWTRGVRRYESATS